jgi:hypothetical protein
LAANPAEKGNGRSVNEISDSGYAAMSDAVEVRWAPPLPPQHRRLLAQIEILHPTDEGQCLEAEQDESKTEKDQIRRDMIAHRDSESEDLIG